MKPKNARRALEAIANASRKSHDSAALALLREAPLFAGDEWHFRNDAGVPVLPLLMVTMQRTRLQHESEQQDLWR